MEIIRHSRGHSHCCRQIAKPKQCFTVQVQAGFIGAWGEWYYSTHFGSGRDWTAEQIRDRAMVLEQLLATGQEVRLRSFFRGQAFGPGQSYVMSAQEKVKRLQRTL